MLVVPGGKPRLPVSGEGAASPSTPPPAETASGDAERRGDGTFASAAGGTGVSGTGVLQRYRVEVENGTGQDADAVAAEVDAVLGNTTRGWSAKGDWSFQRVAEGKPHFTVKLASPATTVSLCRSLGVRTKEDVGWCGGKDVVVVNLGRWNVPAPAYADDIDAYHALTVNQSVGHQLGYRRTGCPGPGEPAPVMMPQGKGLNGCTPNAWPYARQGGNHTGR
ncbi:DUF3152 domain-containing protein [Streptomyces vinaceus]|uniref:DUF3152 domain-containing protein n=1 Tax=Streptomyces vinaceus TaxID=1960 RepID=UPI0037FF9C0E